MSTLSPVVQIQLERPLPPAAFLDRVYDELHRAEKELNPGRLAGLLVEGKLSWEQLKQYAIHMWWLINEIQKTHGYIYQNCPIEAARKELIKNIIVEEGPPGPTHPELYVEYCEKAFGVSRQELESTRPLATTVAARNHILWVALTRSWLEGIAAVIVGGEKGGDKSHDNPLYTMSNALHNRYGISWEALRFFTVHVELEQGEKAEEHGEIGPHLLMQYATTADMQEKVLAAVWDGVMMHKVFFDGVYHHLLGH
jgi:pyrroloquinoline quinone (PQQ) biosynthesis protein C